jgi:hypothetical protein
MTDDDDTLPDRYTERAEATLAYRLMEYLEFLGVITADHVAYLRWPPIELIEDAEAALKDETTTDTGYPVSADIMAAALKEMVK